MPISETNTSHRSTAPSASPIRLGQISFINSLPIVLPIQDNVVSLNHRLTLAAPAELNSLFAEGILDAGAMSAFYFLESKAFTLVKSLSISSIGEVGSVLYFGKLALPKMRHARIAATSLSATSVNLLKILFFHHYGFIPEIVTSENPDIENASIDGVLLIGDKALSADQNLSGTAVRIDLGLWWWQTFRLPMVFGVWAARSEWVRDNPHAFDMLCMALAEAKYHGLGRLLPQVLTVACARTNLSNQRLHKYFRQQLSFELTAPHLQGLRLYAQLAQKLNLLPVGVDHRR